MTKKSKWKSKYKSPADYYKANYDTEFYFFDKYQLEIDPDEALEDIENYDISTQQKEIVKCVESFPYFCQKYIKILLCIKFSHY